MRSQTDNTGTEQRANPHELARGSIFLTRTHTYTHVSDHTYGVVDGFREQRWSVREAGQHELHQHERKVNVESDIAKHVDFSILNVSRGRGKRRSLSGSSLQRPGQRAADPGTRSPALSHVPQQEKSGYTAVRSPMPSEGSQRAKGRLQSGSEACPQSGPGSPCTGLQMLPTLSNFLHFDF